MIFAAVTITIVHVALLALGARLLYRMGHARAIRDVDAAIKRFRAEREAKPTYTLKWRGYWRCIACGSNESSTTKRPVNNICPHCESEGFILGDPRNRDPVFPANPLERVLRDLEDAP